MKNLYEDMTSCGLLKEKPTRTWLRQATFSFRKYWSISGSCFSEEKQKPMPNGYQETIEKGMNAVRYFTTSMSYYISYSGNATVSLYSFCNTLIKASRL